MFIHCVLFEIEPEEVAKYRRDSLMWARYARKYKGFVSYFTMQRIGYRNQYASLYQWKIKQDHDKFMQDLHDTLVKKSRARVKVLGYYNLNKIDKA